jgi:hypothetical protein
MIYCFCFPLLIQVDWEYLQPLQIYFTPQSVLVTSPSVSSRIDVSDQIGCNIHYTNNQYMNIYIYIYIYIHTSHQYAPLLSFLILSYPRLRDKNRELGYRIQL